ncbi:nucleoside hydrolase [Pokkaliibacter plantistimulans]|uniref:Nucleoside hydrolase n=1 Tax=Pokkaliibacter plantistimulans TaxID=1635171 RepID=A0ABX5LXU6_9GAMM|nr:nucleoside hydrolase [Pokkaliibacter plantistimulans]PXF31489.1 nucleoside hydrolase [Pokkaliibacter plantistimulans]
MARKIIIDTDPGIDDAMAILFAFHAQELEVLGLTTTYGNVSVEQSTINALALVELAGKTVPVAKGVAVPRVREPGEFPDFVHGKDGFGNIGWAAPVTQADPRDAAQFIIDQVRAHPGEVTLIALGPLGNLAAALERDPEIAHLVDEVILMGGTWKERGNVSPVAEANIINDPHAADMVFTAPWQVVMIGLDVTHQVLLQNSLLERVRNVNPKEGTFLYDIAQFYINFYSGIHDVEGCYFHDASCVAYALQPDIFGVARGAVRVATDGLAMGQTIICPEGKTSPLPGWDNVPMTDICMEVDSERLLQLFEETLCQ